MKIVLTGCDGYLGSLLGPELLRKGHEVTGVDTGTNDIRQIGVEDLRCAEAMVHMAELSNDPLGQLAPNITYDINHKASVRLAELARKAGVKRFVYMSSCSVYGVAESDYVDETSPVNPQTAYAICKTLVERDLKPVLSHFSQKRYCLWSLAPHAV